VAKAIELLGQLCDGIAARGLNWDEDSRLLSQIFGLNVLEQPPSILFEMYALLARAGKYYDASRGISVGAGEVRDFATRLLNVEIQHLKTLRRVVTELQQRRMDRQKDTVLRLPSELLDRLLHYEAHLDRAFDRTLSQLERLQRMRLGYPLPPPVKVELSH